MPLPFLAFALIVRQDSAAAAPEWTASAVSLAIREGVLGETQYGLYPFSTRGVHDRLGLAILFVQAAARQRLRAEASLAHPDDLLGRAALLRLTPMARAYDWSNAEHRRQFKDLLPTDLIIDTSHLAELSRRLEAGSSSRTHLFRDVPNDCWAAKAVGDLRALGLLDGYPDGRLRR